MEAGTGKTENKYLDGMGGGNVSLQKSKQGTNEHDIHYIFSEHSYKRCLFIRIVGKETRMDDKKESHKKTSRLDAAIKASSEEQLYETKDIDDLMDNLMK